MRTKSLFPHGLKPVSVIILVTMDMDSKGFKGKSRDKAWNLANTLLSVDAEGFV